MPKPTHFIYKEIRTLIIIILLLISLGLSHSKNVFAQNPTDRINPEFLNFKFLEHLIKLKVDSIRVENKLDRLINDTILYLSSRDHARYLTRSDDLSHYQQGSRRKRTYHERAIKYGAEDYYVSENLAKISLGSVEANKSKGLTYDHVANSIISKWVASEGNFANILASSHSIVGVATWYDKDQLELRVAASFAAVTKYYKPHTCPDYFPYSSIYLIEFNADKFDRPQRRYEWGINPQPGSKILDGYRKLNRRINTLGLITRDDSVFVVFNNVRMILSLFDGKNDGLAIELIPKSNYSCSNTNKPPIRREDEFTVKGIILPPVYRDYLLEDINEQKRRPKVDLRYLATIPTEYQNKEYTLNLIVLKSNRIADIITFNQTPEKVFDLALKVSPAKDKLPNPDYYIPRLRRDTLKLRVYFDQNMTNVLPEIGDSIRNWTKDKEIQRAAVYAYASIEGTEGINKRLSEARANEMIVFFNPSDGKIVPTVKVSRENWFYFFKDIEKSKYNFLTNLDPTQVREYVNRKKNSREMEPILARQRFADLRILAYKVVNDITIDGLAISEYKNLYETIKNECSYQESPCIIQQNALDRIELVQLFILNRNLMGRIDWNTIDKLPIAIQSGYFDIENEPLSKLYYNKNRFILSSRGELLSQDDSLSILKELNRFPYPDPIVAYNYFVTLVKNNEKHSFEPFYQQQVLNETQRLITMLEGISFDPIVIDQLRLYYHFKNTEQEYFVNRLGDFEASIKSSLDFISNYYKENPPNNELAKDLSMYFSAFQMYDDAQTILEPYAFSKPPDKEALILYLKYYYANPKVKQNTDFYQFLKDAGDILTPQEWCKLFSGNSPINIQVLDHEPLHIMYCRLCGEIQ